MTAPGGSNADALKLVLQNLNDSMVYTEATNVQTNKKLWNQCARVSLLALVIMHHPLRALCRCRQLLDERKGRRERLGAEDGQRRRSHRSQVHVCSLFASTG
jgi:hypothetical protein